MHPRLASRQANIFSNPAFVQGLLLIFLTRKILMQYAGPYAKHNFLHLTVMNQLIRTILVLLKAFAEEHLYDQPFA